MSGSALYRKHRLSPKNEHLCTFALGSLIFSPRGPEDKGAKMCWEQLLLKIRIFLIRFCMKLVLVNLFNTFSKVFNEIWPQLYKTSLLRQPV